MIINNTDSNEYISIYSNENDYVCNINYIISIINNKLSLYKDVDYNEYKNYVNEFINLINNYQEQPYILDNYLENLCKPITNYLSEFMKSISLNLHETILTLNKINNEDNDICLNDNNSNNNNNNNNNNMHVNNGTNNNDINNNLHVDNDIINNLQKNNEKNINIYNNINDIFRINNNHKNIYRLCDCLYHLCKIRGLKTISLYFPSDVIFLEVIIDYLTIENEFIIDSDLIQDQDINWHLNYVLYVWLTTLVLIPFSYDTLDSKYVLKTDSLFIRILKLIIPKILQDKYCIINETIALVFSKISCRSDFINLWLKDDNIFRDIINNELNKKYNLQGILIWIKYLLKVGPLDNIILFIDKIINYLDINNDKTVNDLNNNNNSFKLINYRIICISNLIIKTLKNNILLNYFKDFDNTLNWTLNLIIEYNKIGNTLIRHTTSKYIAKILSSINNEEYIDKIIKEILILNNINSYNQHGEFNLNIYKNLPPNELEGKCLTIAELTRKRIKLLFNNYLEEIIIFIKYCLNYEYWIGSRNFGIQIRDSACYIIWSLARTIPCNILKPYINEIINSIIPLTVFDININVRRASCAALQEFIGRQGGENIPYGISIITIADFFTISSEKSSFIEISTKIGSLNNNLYNNNTNNKELNLSHELPFSIILINYLMKNIFVHPNIKYRLLAMIALSKLIPYSYYYNSYFKKIIYTITNNNNNNDNIYINNNNNNIKNSYCYLINEDLNIYNNNYIYRHSSLLILSIIILHGNYLNIENNNFWKEKVNKKNKINEKENNTQRNLLNRFNVDSIPNDFTWSDYIRNIPIIVENKRFYRGKGGDLTRKGVLYIIISLCKSIEFIEFKKSTFKRFLQTINDSIKHLSFTIQMSGCSAINALIYWRMNNSNNSDELKEIQNLIIEYINYINNNMIIHIMALRGFILALGIIFFKIMNLLNEQVIKNIIYSIIEIFKKNIFIISNNNINNNLTNNNIQNNYSEFDKYFIHSKYDIECRRNSIISLGFICLNINNSSFYFKEEILNICHEIFILGCYDYSIDKRGDVGSWIREISMEILACLYTNNVFNYNNDDYYHKMIQAFIFNIFNYSEKIRFKAIILLWKILDKYFNNTLNNSNKINIYWIYYRIFYGIPYELYELIQLKNVNNIDYINNIKDDNLSLKYKLYKSCYLLIDNVIQEYKLTYTKENMDEITSFFNCNNNPFNNSCYFFDLLNSLELIPHSLLPYVDFDHQFLFCISNRNFQIFSNSNIQVFKKIFFPYIMEESIQKHLLFGLINWINHDSACLSALNIYLKTNIDNNFNSVFNNIESLLNITVKYIDNINLILIINILKFILLLFKWNITPLDTNIIDSIVKSISNIYFNTKDYKLIKVISSILVHLSFNLNNNKINNISLNLLALIISHEYPNIRLYTADYIYNNICHIQECKRIEGILEFIRDTEWNSDLNISDLYQIKMQFIQLTRIE